MASHLFLSEAPPLNPTWLAYEKANGLVNAPAAQETITPADALRLRQRSYAKSCRDRNERLTSPTSLYHSLLSDIQTHPDSTQSPDGATIHLRIYIPTTLTHPQDFIIYYHGGGLCVGDLDSEDLQCRRLAKDLGIKVVSVEYRLFPDHSPDTAVADAWAAFLAIAKLWKYNADQQPGRVYIVGSSSGAQLAAQTAHRARGTPYLISGLVLRCPVTVDASRGGVSIPQRYEDKHTSFSPSFGTNLLSFDPENQLPIALDMPLNSDSFAGMPPMFLQLCTNDIYYSDGACYADALTGAGNDLVTDVLEGWPHTFWLKAPELEEAGQADGRVIAWLKQRIGTE
jgi:acetyl esterase/lipase